MVKAVIFDRDGVIVNSSSIHIKSVEKAFESLGINITEDDKMYVVSKHPKEYVKHFSKKYEFSEDDFLREQEINYNNMFEKASLDLFENTIDVVKKLKDKEIKLALVTSSDRKSTDKVLSKANLEGVFDATVTVEEVVNRKPNPEPYLLAMKKLDLSSNDCIIVEDSSTGLESAKRARVKCIIIPNEYTLGHDFSLADFKIEDPNEIIGILSGLNNE